MGLLIGLFIPVAVFFIRRFLDTKVKYYNDVTSITSAPFLCEILSTIESDEVQLELADPARAGLILPSEDAENEELLMLLMPMLLND